MGEMDVSVLVPDERTGRDELTLLIQELAPGARFAIEVVPEDDEGVSAE